MAKNILCFWLLKPKLFKSKYIYTIVMAMIEKTFTNNELKIELISYIDTKQNIWFKVKDIAKILRYIHTDQALRKHIDSENRKS